MTSRCSFMTELLTANISVLQSSNQKSFSEASECFMLFTKRQTFWLFFPEHVQVRLFSDSCVLASSRKMKVRQSLMNAERQFNLLKPQRQLGGLLGGRFDSNYPTVAFPEVPIQLGSNLLPERGRRELFFFSRSNLRDASRSCSLTRRWPSPSSSVAPI